MTLQPEWRKQATKALKDPSVDADTQRAAEDITCTSGDPFHMLMQQLNTVIIDWIESGVNNLVVYPINRDLIHTANHALDAIDKPIAEIKKAVDVTSDAIDDIKKILDSAGDAVDGFVEGAGNVGKDIWNTVSSWGRRMDEAFEDVRAADANGTAPLSASQRRKMGDINRQFAQLGVRLVSNLAGPVGKHVVSNTAQSVLGIDGKIDVRDGHEGTTSSGLIDYLPYIEDICIPNPAVEGKCINDGTNEHFKECEDPELAGGLDHLCCALSPSNLHDPS